MADEKPDEGLLSEPERARIRDWFNKFHPGGLACPICKQAKWSVLDHFVTPVMLGGESRAQLNFGSAYPCFVLTCDSCGNAELINALKTGIIEPPVKGGHDNA